MREETATFCIYASERCQNAPLSPWRRKNLLTKREMCPGSFFSSFYFYFSFWCHLSNAVGVVVALEARTTQSFATFQSIFSSETAARGLFKGEAVRSRHWSALLLPHCLLTTVKNMWSGTSTHFHIFPDFTFRRHIWLHPWNQLPWPERRSIGKMMHAARLLSGGCGLIKSGRLTVKPIPNCTLFILTCVCRGGCSWLKPTVCS